MDSDVQSELGAEPTAETEEAESPEPSEPSFDDDEVETEKDAPAEPWEAPPHWPAPRYVRRETMMRGHVREPETPPLIEDWEMHLFFGLMGLAIGFVLTGGGGLFGLWLVMRDQIWRSLPFGG